MGASGPSLSPSPRLPWPSTPSFSPVAPRACPMHRSHIRSVTAVLRAVIPLTLVACWSDRPTGPSDNAAPPHPLAPSAVVAGAEVLVGAGQLATCDGTNDDKTAALLDNIQGTVFTAGDNIRASGSA